MIPLVTPLLTEVLHRVGRKKGTKKIGEKPLAAHIGDTLGKVLNHPAFPFVNVSADDYADFLHAADKRRAGEASSGPRRRVNIRSLEALEQIHSDRLGAPHHLEWDKAKKKFKLVAGDDRATPLDTEVNKQHRAVQIQEARKEKAKIPLKLKKEKRAKEAKKDKGSKILSYKKKGRERF